MLRTRTKAGKLDREIVLLKMVITDGSSNEDIGTPALVDTDPYVFAEVFEPQGTETIDAERVAFVQRTVFRIYHRTDIDTSNRVYYNSKVYSIVSVSEESRNRFLLLSGYLLDTEEFST